MRVLICLALLLANSAVAQNEPSFDVVSVRATPGIPVGWGTEPRIADGRLSWITTAFSMVSYAYGIPGWRVSGMKSEMSFYTINATMNRAAKVDEVRGMLRRMLMERFGFAAHWESKEASGYTLVVGKNGPRFDAAGSEVAPMPTYFSTKPAEVFEKRALTTVEGRGTLAITGRRVPMESLAFELSGALSTFVDERTGLSGDYYFAFQFQRPDYLPGGAVDLAPSVFDAIRDLLGLSLEKAKRPVDYLVVDSISKLPTEN